MVKDLSHQQIELVSVNPVRTTFVTARTKGVTARTHSCDGSYQRCHGSYQRGFRPVQHKCPEKSGCFCCEAVSLRVIAQTARDFQSRSISTKSVETD